MSREVGERDVEAGAAKVMLKKDIRKENNIKYLVYAFISYRPILL